MKQRWCRDWEYTHLVLSQLNSPKSIRFEACSTRNTQRFTGEKLHPTEELYTKGQRGRDYEVAAGNRVGILLQVSSSTSSSGRLILWPRVDFIGIRSRFFLGLYRYCISGLAVDIIKTVMSSGQFSTRCVVHRSDWVQYHIKW